MVVVHDMGLCFAWDGPSVSGGSISVTGLQRSLGSESLQLDLFYCLQGNFVLFTLRWVSWLYPRTELSQDFETLNISFPSKHTHTCHLVSVQNWGHSPKETPGMCFSCSLSTGSCAVWRQSGNRWVSPYCKQRMQKSGKKERESDDRWQKGVNTLWCARGREKQGSRGKGKEALGRSRQGAQPANQE